MFRDFGAKNGTHVKGFFVKNRLIWAAHPRIAFLWEYPPGSFQYLMSEKQFCDTKGPNGP